MRVQFWRFRRPTPEPFEEYLPLAHCLPELSNELCSLGLRQCEHGVRAERVVERREPALWADAQVQETLGRVARAR